MKRKIDGDMEGGDMYFENDEQDVPKTIRRRKKQLYAAIRERMEFYFSDANLAKDRYLSQFVNKNPEVDLEVFMKFNKILQLTNSINDLIKALKKSEFLQLTEDKRRVFRVTPVKERTNTDACTIYVEQLPCDADHDWLKDVFSKFGKVVYISIPKYKSSGKIKGFAFVEFDTPEFAQKAVEEFEKAGCCLTNQMSPEELCSITTYEDDKSENKSQFGRQTNDANNKDSETEKKASKRRKNSEKETPGEDDDSAPVEKKRRRRNETEEKQSDREAEAEEEEEEEEEEESKGKETDEAGGTKKKKNRKKKKSHKTKYVRDIQSYGLQILSKADWKRLRNKYLNIQKEKMKKLKQNLYKSQMSHSQRQQQIIETQTKPRFEFKTGVVVKVTFEEPLSDSNSVSQFKCSAKTLDNVEYVDVTQGSSECYIRFGNEQTVQEIMQSKPWENMTVLEGEEEQEYWEKMKRDRSEKFDNRKKFSNKRGRIKLINKAEKLISKRIRLSVDE